MLFPQQAFMLWSANVTSYNIAVMITYIINCYGSLGILAN